MIRNLGTNRKLWLATASVAVVAAAIGIVDQSIYDPVSSDEILPGIVSQDLITVLLSSLTLLMTWRMKDGDSLRQVAVLGMLGYLFYGYGIYVIEQIYTPLYFLYLAVFGLASYSIAYLLASIDTSVVNRARVPKTVRIVSIAFLIVIAIMFVALWSSQLVPLIEDGEKKEFTFSIYILDLCFIMPACVIAAVMSARNKGLGILMTPALFVIGSTVLASPGLGGVLMTTVYDEPANAGEIAMFLALSLVFLVLAALNFWKIEVGGETADEP